MTRKKQLRSYGVKRCYNSWGEGGVPSKQRMFNGEEKNKWVSTKFLFGKDIIRPYAECPICSENMTFMTNPWDLEKAGKADCISGNKNCFMMCCKACKKKRSVFHGTLFFNTHLKIHTFVDYFCMWLCKTDRMATAGVIRWHEKTVMKYNRILREAVSTHIYLDIEGVWMATIPRNCA